MLTKLICQLTLLKRLVMDMDEIKQACDVNSVVQAFK